MIELNSNNLSKSFYTQTTTPKTNKHPIRKLKPSFVGSLNHALDNVLCVFHDRFPEYSWIKITEACYAQLNITVSEYYYYFTLIYIGLWVPLAHRTEKRYVLLIAKCRATRRTNSYKEKWRQFVWPFYFPDRILLITLAKVGLCVNVVVTLLFYTG